MIREEVEFYQTLSNEELREVIRRMAERQAAAETVKAAQTAEFLRRAATEVLSIREAS